MSSRSALVVLAIALVITLAVIYFIKGGEIGFVMFFTLPHNKP